MMAPRPHLDSLLDRERPELALLRLLPEPMTVQSRTGELVAANALGARQLGFDSVDQLLSVPPAELLAHFEAFREDGSPFPREELPSRIALTGVRPPETLIRFRIRRTGEERWALTSAIPLGEPTGYVLNVFRDVTEQKVSERALQLVADASALLSGSLDYEATLTAVTRAVVPSLADWCSVSLIVEGEPLPRTVAVHHVDPAKLELARRLSERYPADPNAPRGLPAVLRTGQTEWARELPAGLLEQTARDAEHLALIRTLQLRSYIVVPLKVRDRILGGLSLITAESGRVFSERDVAVAEELARRAAIAVDHARVYDDAKKANERLTSALGRAQQLSAEQAAREHAEAERGRIEQILGSIADPFFVVDGAWRITYINDAALTAGQMRREQVLGKSYWEVTGQTADHPTALRYERVRSSRTPDHWEEPAPATGQWFEVHVFPTGDGVSVYFREITERKRGEERRARSARHALLRAEVSNALAGAKGFRQMLQESCEAIVRNLDGSFARVWTLSPDGQTLELQASAGKYTHLDGGHARVPMGAFKIGRIAQNLRPHLTNDVQHDPEVGNPEWAKREKMVAFAGYPLVVDGLLVGVVAMFAEHPLHDESLEALAGVADSIAQGVRRWLAEENLAEHAKELARSNTDLQQFAYVASHDLQEPLRMVASYTQLLARRYKGKLDADADEFIAYTVDGVTRMQQLINDLLTYSRVGTRGREPAPVSLAKVVAASTRNLEVAIAQSGAEVRVEGALPTVGGDEPQLIQLFQNLIANAIKFKSPAPPRIEIAAVARGADWELTVRDNGIGIAPEYFDRVFVIFQRLHTRTEYPGNGIGLAICKKIVERHGGRIWIDSAPERGSTFHFTLPAIVEKR